ncbi:MAG: type II CRISPR RNA-guided endonuclease Cas9 [Anaeroglobus sp.]|nr:type II CRISPR RNA-guided endonuclease Cas9 [Anaeroglobus sp.]
MDTKELKYVVGLDIGITSVGWATLLLDSQDEPVRILDLNSRIFDKAEVPKTGASLAAPRRMARGVRRRLRRRKFRLHRVRQYILRHHILDKAGLECLYKPKTDIDIFALRTAGLDRLLEPEEWARILLYMAKHRGFKSNRKSASDASDDGDMLDAIRKNKEVLSKYRSVGEMFDKDEKFSDHKRNKGGSYEFTVARSMLVDEIKLLFEKQRDFGLAFAEKDAEEEYIELFSAQRNFDEGPGGDSPYGGNQIEKMIGLCTFEGKNGEKRAPKASYAFMATNLWQKINQIRIIEKGTERPLTAEEAGKIDEKAWKKEAMTYKDIRSEISLGDEASFKGLSYKWTETDKEETESKAKFSWVKEYHTLRKVLDKVEKNRILQLSYDDIDNIAYIFSVYKNDDKIREALEGTDLDSKDIDVLIENLGTFSKFGHLSLKACYKILPYLEQGMVYSDACTAAGYDFRKSAQGSIADIPNPVVKRAISQTMKVLKAIKQKYGCPPVEIHIEMARELAKSFDERQKMTKSIEENQSHNERIKERLQKEFNVPYPSGQDIVKLKLYEEQNETCAYSQKHIDAAKLFHDPNYAEVDHIIPYSRSFDDTYNNKVLVLTAENRQKGNRTPMEYLSGDEARKKQFVAWVKSDIKKPRKRENLLREKFTADAENDWKARHLQDTQYISRFMLNYLQNNYELTPGNTDRRRRIIPVNGAVTAYVRKRLGISKIRENGDLHHAVDAAVIAAVTQGVVNSVSRYSKRHELQYHVDEHGNCVDLVTGELMGDAFKENHKIKGFPEPWPQFRAELEARVSENAAEAIRILNLPTYSPDEEIKTPFVSRMVRHKTTGQAHEDTVRGKSNVADNVYVKKVALTELKLKDGEIEGYYNPSSDRLLYEALKKRLEQFDGKGKDAFKEPFHKPKSDGSPGPIVKKCKVLDKINLAVQVHGGNGATSNANGSMIRVDIFKVQEKNGKHSYYSVPIYVADTVKAELPKKAVYRRPYDEWPEMKEADFAFSLYPNDVVYIGGKEIKMNVMPGCTLESEKSMRDEVLYFKGLDIATGAIQVVNHDGTYKQRSLGIKQLPIIEKYEVSVLGDLVKAPYRPREIFKHKTQRSK